MRPYRPHSIDEGWSALTIRQVPHLTLYSWNEGWEQASPRGCDCAVGARQHPQVSQKEWQIQLKSLLGGSWRPLLAGQCAVPLPRCTLAYSSLDGQAGKGAVAVALLPSAPCPPPQDSPEAPTRVDCRSLPPACTLWGGGGRLGTVDRLLPYLLLARGLISAIAGTIIWRFFVLICIRWVFWLAWEVTNPAWLKLMRKRCIS